MKKIEPDLELSSVNQVFEVEIEEEDEAPIEDPAAIRAEQDEAHRTARLRLFATLLSFLLFLPRVVATVLQPTLFVSLRSMF